MSHHRRVVIAAAVVLAFVVVGCIPAPVGPAPLRYRDLLFANATTVSGVPYATTTTRQGQPVTLTADLYRPAGDTAGRRPAIVWVHGGGFVTGLGDKTAPEIVDEATTFARKGYVGLSIDYRLSATGCLAPGPPNECALSIDDALVDAQTAVRWLRANATILGIDPDRIAIAGTSAGAITALNVGYNGDAPPGGPYPGFSSRVRAAVALSGAAIPRSAISAGDAPALLFHGTADPLVAYASAKSTADTANAVGDYAYLVTWPGEGHVPYYAHRNQVLDTMTNFFYVELGLAA